MRVLMKMTRFNPWILILLSLLLLACNGGSGGEADADEIDTEGDSGNAETVTVNLSAAQGTVNSGSTVKLIWQSSGANRCAASGGWSGNKSNSGEQTVGPLFADTQYRLRCSGDGGSDDDSVTVTVSAAAGSQISGAVDSQFIDRLGVNRVYVFSGDVTPDDIDGAAGDPVTVAEVTQITGSCYFQYAASGLGAGDYTIAFTNQAADDDPGDNDAITFSGRTVVTVGAGSTIHNFAATGVLRVGAGQIYSKPSEAAAVASSGDVIEIEAGTYAGDATYWDASNITIRGVNGRAHMKAQGAYAGGKGTWVITGDDIKVENIEFSEASVPDENGAGIRNEGNNLTICNSYFHDNENGILGGAYGTLIIEYSEFAANGFGDGYTHNLYIDDGGTLIFRHNYSHHAKIGHNLKTRAQNNYILYNRIMDEVNGTASYAIDVPEGGLTYVIGNLLQQGDDTDNSILFSYGAEGLSGDGRLHRLYAVNNTFVSDRSPPGSFTSIAGGTSTVLFKNNLFVGGASTPAGIDSTNVVTNSPGFIDRGGFNYDLLSTSPAVNKGEDPGSATGYDLAPLWQYLHEHNRETRPVNGALDAGAYEYSP